MRQVVLGTAGHVDHGKTALVRALTGVETDRLPEEQRRGITIELGFAPWPIGDDLLVSVIDAPGHRRLVHTMIAGAAGIEIVLLAVAADEGVMPQTREHVAACRLLGVERAVVAVTKLDRADAELAELAGEEARELCAAHGIEATVVACSARTGAGVEGVRDAVRATILALPGRDPGGRVRLWVDRVFSVHGAGTVVTGTLVEGRLRLGDALRIVGPERELAVAARALHVHGRACDDVSAPTRLAINLVATGGRGRATVEEVDRGDLVTNDASICPTRVADVWLEPAAGVAIRRGSQATMFVGTTRSSARIQPIDAGRGAAASELPRAEAAPTPRGQAAAGTSQPEGLLARLRLGGPLVVAGGDRFVLRGADVEGPAGAVIGGGVVLDARPPRALRAAKRVGLLQAAEAADAPRLVEALVAEARPRPLLRAELGARFRVPAEEIVTAAQALGEQGRLVEVQAVGWLDPAGLAALHDRARALVAEHHRTAPLEPGLRLQTLREQLAALAGVEATAELLARLGAGAPGAAPGSPGARLVIAGDVVRMASFGGAEQDERSARALGTVRELLAKAALQGATEHVVGQATQTEPKETRALLALLGRQEQVVRSGDLYFEARAVDALGERVREHLGREGRLTIAAFKELTGLGRRQVIPLLEHFDRTGITRRAGDDRVAGSAASRAASSRAERPDGRDKSSGS